MREREGWKKGRKDRREERGREGEEKAGGGEKCEEALIITEESQPLQAVHEVHKLTRSLPAPQLWAAVRLATRDWQDIPS